jgi:hypothetical protein
MWKAAVPRRAAPEVRGATATGGTGGTGGMHEPDASIVGSPDGGQPGGPDGGPVIDCTEGLVWNDRSTRVEIYGFHAINGSSLYEKDAADLSAEQVMALRKLCVVDHLSRPRTDFRNYMLTVRDALGVAGLYYAAENDLVSTRDMRLDYLTFASLSGFLKTFKCRTSKEPGSTARLTDAGLTDDAELPVLSADPGCVDGVSFSFGPGKQYFTVPVATPGTLTIEAVSCFQMMGLRLLDPGSFGELASTGLNGASCPTLQIHLMEAGSYVVEVQKENLPGMDGGIYTSGDFYLRHSLAP